MDLWTGGLNYLAMVIVTLIPMALGSWWYSTVGLGQLWMRLVGKTEEELRAQDGMAIGFTAVTLGVLVLSYVLALLTRFVGAGSFVDGLVLGLWLWVGVVATTSVGHYVFGGHGLRLWALDNAYPLIAVPIMAGILAAWR